MIFFLLAIFGGLITSGAEAKSLYSYTDDKGTRIITDNYQKIPDAYRAKVIVVEQEPDGYLGEIERVGELVGSAKGFVVPLPGDVRLVSPVASSYR